MADVLTHILYTEDMLNLLKNEILNEQVQKTGKLINFASQGADFFYYSQFWNISKKSSITNVGKLLHTKKVSDFFYEGYRLLSNNKESEYYPYLCVYYLGLVCHYNLDRIIHPYVFYNCGFDDKKSKNSKIYGIYHEKFEMAIDTLMYQKLRNKDASKEKIYELINFGHELPEIITYFYRNIIKKLFGIELTTKSINGAYKDMKLFYRLLYDPCAIKNNMMRPMKMFSNNVHLMLTCKFHNAPWKVEKEGLDYLNRNNNQWFHPCDKTKVYKTSFEDLYVIALEKGKKMLNATFDRENVFLDKHKDIVYNIFKNRSYLTNMPCEGSYPIQYYDPLFEKN